MRNGAKLSIFFAVSVALHGAGLWAAAGRIEPRSPEPPAEVAIVDRDLFFRHAARSELRPSQPLSATVRLDAEPGQASEAQQAAPAATEAEAERRRPATPPRQEQARLEPAVPDAAPADRRRAARSEQTDAEPVEAARMPAVAAAPPPALPAIRTTRAPAPDAPLPAWERLTGTAPGEEARPAAATPLAPADDTVHAARPRASPLGSTPGSQRLRHSAGIDAQPDRVSAETAIRIESDERLPSPDLEWPETVSAQRLERERAIAPRRSAGPPLTEIAPAQATDEPERLAARDGPPALRGTLPLLSLPREAQPAQPVDASDPAPARRGGLRVGAASPAAPVPERTRATAVPSRTAPPPQARQFRSPSAPPDLPAAEARQPAPQQRSALAPAEPTRRAQTSDQPTSGMSDPAGRFTRRYRTGECFFPLRLASSGEGAIRGYGVEAESVRMFRQAFAQALGSDPQVDWRPLTDAQCSGISFTRLILGDSAPSLRIGLRHKELQRGQDLAGRVTGSRLEFFTLLVLDDSGLVHNIIDYLHEEPGGVDFSVPVHPVDDGTDRVQLIVAVGSSRPLPALVSTGAVHSDDFFPALLQQARDAGAALELGLEDFVIRSDGES